MGDPVFTARNLRRQGLEPVSLELRAGESVVITGASGSGKTLLLRAMADLDPNDGDLSLGGTRRADMPPPDWRRQVRYVAAEPGWWADIVAAHFSDPQAAKRRCPDLGIDAALVDKPVARLSTGERQRLALIRALEKNPKLLLLDEPTGALDAENAARVVALLKSLLKSGLAIIVVTHDPGIGDQLGGRHFRMQGGRLAAA